MKEIEALKDAACAYAARALTSGDGDSLALESAALKVAAALGDARLNAAHLQIHVLTQERDQLRENLRERDYLRAELTKIRETIREVVNLLAVSQNHEVLAGKLRANAHQTLVDVLA